MKMDMINFRFHSDCKVQSFLNVFFFLSFAVWRIIQGEFRSNYIVFGSSELEILDDIVFERNNFRRFKLIEQILENVK